MTTDTADLAARFARIRRFYGAHERAILSDGMEWFGDHDDPLYGDAYGWEHDGGIVLTPIEREIEAMGWAVYRLTGKQCGTDFAEVEDESGRVRWQACEARALVRRIAHQHFKDAAGA